jgi:hypothetical protein
MRGNDLRLGADATLSPVSFFCVHSIGNDSYLFDAFVGNDSLHECDGVVALFQVPFVENYIDAVLSQLSCEIKNPLLMIGRTPTIRDKVFWERSLIYSCESGAPRWHNAG